jgi:uncharacterized protein
MQTGLMRLVSPVSLVTGVLSLLLAGGCATYSDVTQEMRTSFYSGSSSRALETLDKSKVAKSKGDEVLYRMERGSLLYDMKQFSGATKEWERASRRLDELYTISLSKQAASLAISEDFADYEGEAHERVLLPVFSALAFLSQGEPQKAIVEARRTNEILKILENDKRGNPKLQENLFAHYLSGYIYEMRSDWDAAIVEYRKALAASQKSSAQDVVVDALMPLAQFRRRQDVLAEINRKGVSKGGNPWSDPGNPPAELLVVFEAGKAPVKEPEDIPVPVSGGVINISFPRYQNMTFGNTTAQVLVGGRSQASTVVLQDIGELARAALSARRAREITRMVARVIAKDQAARAAGRALGPLAQIAASVAGAVTERADTRSWTLLPNTLQVARISLTPGQVNEVMVRPGRGPSETFRFTPRPGEKKFVRLRTLD